MGRAHWPTTVLGVEVVADALALRAKARAAATADGLTVATRDMRRFEAAHVGVINPGLG